MCFPCNEKRRITYDRRNRTTKSRHDLNARSKETNKYLGILEADNIKQVVMKDKI